MFKQYELKKYRFRLIAYALILCIIGILVIGSAKESVQSKQVIGLIAGLAIMAVVSLIDYNRILKFRRIFYVGACALLVLVLFMGSNTNGATRWIEFSGIRFQPSELCKILLILYFAGFLMKRQEKINTWQTIVAYIVLMAIPMLLVYREPDLSTTIIMMLIMITLLFVAGLSYKIVLGVICVAIPAFIAGVILILKHLLPIQEYQYTRILSWLQPAKYADDALQQQNSIMAIGSGQILGKGLANDSVLSVKNGNFIPEPQTDFIFSVLGEELGFAGCIIVIILFLVLVIECIIIGKNARNLGGRLICCGVASWIGYQAFVNICVTTGLLPNTGLTLPFISYGLTSLLSLFIGLGLVLNVGLQEVKHRTGDFDLL